MHVLSGFQGNPMRQEKNVCGCGLFKGEDSCILHSLAKPDLWELLLISSDLGQTVLAVAASIGRCV